MSNPVRNRKAELCHLKSLRRSLEAGCCGILRVKIQKFKDKLTSSPDADIRDEFADIMTKANEAFDTEALHGRGSLLQLDHPVVRDLIGEKQPRVPPIIPPEEVEAARRYQALRSQAV